MVCAQQYLLTLSLCTSVFPLHGLHFFRVNPLQCWTPVCDAGKYLLHCGLPMGCKWCLAPTTPPCSLNLVVAGLFLTVFPHSSLPMQSFHSFLNMFSQRCYQFGWWVHLCPAMGPLGMAGSSCNHVASQRLPLQPSYCQHVDTGGQSLCTGGFH